MAIFVTGDTHGCRRPGMHSVDGYLHRLSKESFPEQRKLSKEDYVVICGDFGGVWETNRLGFEEPDTEKRCLDLLDAMPFTTLIVPGNHENYDRLMGCHNEALLDSWLYAKMPPGEKQKLRQGYPRKEWHGGYVRVLRPSVLMLGRGDIFDLNGRSCFAFGGARSHDIRGGILDPANFPDEKSFRAEYKARYGSMFRVRGVSWWDEEIPSEEEMEHGRKTLQAYMAAHDRVDFVFTHTAPASDMLYLGYSSPDPVSVYLESLRDIMQYGKWFYGHLHDNRRVMDTHYLLYEQIIRIC